MAVVQIDGNLVDENSLISSATAHPPVDAGLSRLLSGCFPNPAARGSIMLDPTDPSLPPLVSPNLLGNTSDAENLMVCLQRQDEVKAAFPPDWNLQLVYPPQDVTSDLSVVRRTAQSGNHHIGGAHVGPVLGPDLKVKGFTNMRVVDASAIPPAGLQDAGALLRTRRPQSPAYHADRLRRSRDSPPSSRCNACIVQH